MPESVVGNDDFAVRQVFEITCGIGWHTNRNALDSAGRPPGGSTPGGDNHEQAGHPRHPATTPARVRAPNVERRTPLGGKEHPGKRGASREGTLVRPPTPEPKLAREHLAHVQPTPQRTVCTGLSPGR